MIYKSRLAKYLPKAVYHMLIINSWVYMVSNETWTQHHNIYIIQSKDI